MSKVWTVQHGRVHLHVIIERCTRAGWWGVDLRCRDGVVIDARRSREIWVRRSSVLVVAGVARYSSYETSAVVRVDGRR